MFRCRHVFLVAALSFGILGCEENILHDLDEFRANKVLVLLSRKDIDAAKQRTASGWSISVADKDVDGALAVLEESRIFNRDGKKKKQQSRSIIQSSEEKKRTIELQLASDLEATLERLPGVLEARVHLNLRSKERLQISSRSKKQSASALIILEDTKLLDPLQAGNLIAGAAGVAKDEVSVILVAAKAYNGREESPEVSEVVNSLPQKIPIRPEISPDVVSLSSMLALVVFGIVFVRNRRFISESNYVDEEPLFPGLSGNLEERQEEGDDEGLF